jgi:hypothetical protein
VEVADLSEKCVLALPASISTSSHRFYEGIERRGGGQLEWFNRLTSAYRREALLPYCAFRALNVGILWKGIGVFSNVGIAR